MVLWLSGRTLVFDRWAFAVLRLTYSWRVTTRDGFEDSMFEAKASSLWGQGQFSSRPRPVLLEAMAKASIFEAKAKASDHDCWKK